MKGKIKKEEGSLQRIFFSSSCAHLVQHPRSNTSYRQRVSPDRALRVMLGAVHASVPAFLLAPPFPPFNERGKKEREKKKKK